MYLHCLSEIFSLSLLDRKVRRKFLKADREGKDKGVA
jgi:hypothetical protein